MPGDAKKDLSAQQARALLGTVRPRDVVGKTHRRLASELIGELVVIDKKIKIAKQEFTDLVNSTGSRLMDLTGIGPSGAARLLGVIGGTARFTSRAHFASWNGTAPIDTSSGEQNRHASLLFPLQTETEVAGRANGNLGGLQRTAALARRHSCSAQIAL